MITPVNQINQQGYYFNKQTASKNNSVQNINDEMQLSGYRKGIAILARNNINFKSKLSKFDVNLNVGKQYNYPEINVDIKPKEMPLAKQGSFVLYSFSLNDQILENAKNSSVKSALIDISSKGVSFKILSTQENYINVLNELKNEFLIPEINSSHVNEAKKISQVAFSLNKKSGDFKDEFLDIPQDMTNETYEQLINKITTEDVNKFKNDIYKNSNITVNINTNNDYYQKNKDELIKVIEVLKNDKSISGSEC